MLAALQEPFPGNRVASDANDSGQGGDPVTGCHERGVCRARVAVVELDGGEDSG